MAVNYKIEERRVIPNWRDFRRTVKLKELSVSGVVPVVKIDLTTIINDWNENNSIGTAAELVNGSFLAEEYDFKEIKEATQYIINHSDKSSNVLLDIARSINDYNIGSGNLGSFNLKELEVDSLEQFQTHFENQTIYRILSRTRNLTRIELRNPIVWVDLSRLYAFFGQEDKAEKAMIVALELAPDNRYVLRSATRLFIHFEKHEKALYYLRKSDATKSDPWLISAHIATSSMMNRYSPLIKSGIILANSRNYSDYELTELTSSLGTLEYQEGSMKKAKKFLQQSIISPNDNSLAQMEWLGYKEKAFAIDAPSFKNVSNPFEAFAFDAYKAGNWIEVINNCVFWFLDIPYSKRPVLLGSYVASMFLKDYKAATMLCEAGLKAKPNDPILLNNIAYSLLMMNELDKAEPYLNAMFKIKFSTLATDDAIPIQATFGLAAFRSGEVETGQRYYEQAITAAQESKNDYMEKLAILTYFRELVSNNCKEKIMQYASLVEKLKTSDSMELQQLKTEAMGLYGKYQNIDK